MQFCLNIFQIHMDINQIPTIQDSLQVPPLSTGGVLYVPSSIQKKRAIMMYFLLGIVMVINEKKTNEFEYFHLKQAIGWRIGFLILLLVSVLLLPIPYIKWLGILLLFFWAISLVFFIKQARDGSYKKDINRYRGAIFPSLGNWVVSLFDLSFEEQDTQNKLQ